MSKIIFITGASRGIGREIALKFAKQGAMIAIAAKTDKPHPKLSGTIHSVAEEIEALGGHALPLCVDVRDQHKVLEAIEQTVAHFGHQRLDVLINNASAISLTKTEETPIKRYDLMQAVNTRATFVCSQAAIPHLKNSDNAHILTLSPPLNLDKAWFGAHLAYTISKYGMSMCTLGLSEELKKYKIAANSLWPRTTIATAAIEVHFPDEIYQASRKPAIMADAADWILSQDAKEVTGNCFIDEDVLKQSGITDFSKYAVNSEVKLYQDLFL
jgi:citronellol/citronellal dehydrogenase